MSKDSAKSTSRVDSLPPHPLPLNEVLAKAGKRALGGGLPGAAAMFMQVLTLMPMRTAMNREYSKGGGMAGNFRALYNDGGVRRFYRGVGPALFQGPLSRFGDTAANAGMLSLLDSYEATRNLNVGIKTLGASAAAATWRIALMPIDACKTILQVEGAQGLKILGKKVKTSGPLVLYHGALGASGATFVGHYPWFATYNMLQAYIPRYDDSQLKRRARDGLIGFTASVVSDTTSNSIRVVKTTKQTSSLAITYPQAIKQVVEADGIAGLFGRGLKTRIAANGLQGMLFSILWKFFEEKFREKQH